jgi:hypothetical protein
VPLAITLAVLLGVTDDEPARPNWFPAHGMVGLTGLWATNGTPTPGLELQGGGLVAIPTTSSLITTHEALVLGVGGRVLLGASDFEGCSLCMARQTFGPMLRVGYAVSERAAEKGFTFPDGVLFLQVSPSLVRESLPDAPLVPGGVRLAFACRVELGVSVIAWTAAIFKLVGLIASEGSTEVGVVTLPLFLIAFLNHLSLSWEWSAAAFSTSTSRFGGTVGVSF